MHLCFINLWKSWWKIRINWYQLPLPKTDVPKKLKNTWLLPFKVMMTNQRKHIKSAISPMTDPYVWYITWLGYIDGKWQTMKIWHTYKVVPPQWCLLVYNPNNYRYNPLINPSEIVLINQLNTNYGAPPCTDPMGRWKLCTVSPPGPRWISRSVAWTTTISFS